MTSISPDEECVKAAVQSLAKLEQLTDAPPAVFGAPQPKVEPALQGLEIASTEHCVFDDTSLYELEDPREPEMGCALHPNVSAVLPESQCSTRSVHSQASSEHGVFCRADTKYTMRSVSSVIVLGAHGLFIVPM